MALHQVREAEVSSGRLRHLLNYRALSVELLLDRLASVATEYRETEVEEKALTMEQIMQLQLSTAALLIKTRHAFHKLQRMVPEVEEVVLIPMDYEEVAEALCLLLWAITLCHHHQIWTLEVGGGVAGAAMVEVEGPQEVEEGLHKYSSRNSLRA